MQNQDFTLLPRVQLQQTLTRLNNRFVLQLGGGRPLLFPFLQTKGFAGLSQRSANANVPALRYIHNSRHPFKTTHILSPRAELFRALRQMHAGNCPDMSGGGGASGHTPAISDIIPHTSEIRLMMHRAAPPSFQGGGSGGCRIFVVSNLHLIPHLLSPQLPSKCKSEQIRHEPFTSTTRCRAGAKLFPGPAEVVLLAL